MNPDRLGEVREFFNGDAPMLVKSLIQYGMNQDGYRRLMTEHKWSNHELRSAAIWFRELGSLMNEGWPSYWADKFRDEFLKAEGF